MGGSSSSGTSTSMSRYAPYIESQHEKMLELAFSYATEKESDSPYTGYETIDVDLGFFGSGYVISSFPSLYDSFGKYMSGLDIESIFPKLINNILGASQISTFRDKDRTEKDDEVKTSIAEYSLNARQLNTTGSSSFIIGLAKIEDERIKKWPMIMLELQSELLPELNNALSQYLNWQKTAITSYALNMQKYYMVKGVSEEANYSKYTQDSLWPIYVWDRVGDALSTLEQRANFTKFIEKRKRSVLSGSLSVASWAVSGAALGWYVGTIYPGVGNVVGAVVGAVIGAAIGAVLWLIE